MANATSGLAGNPYFRLMRFDRPIGTLLLLWPTLWGLWFAADGWPGLPVLLIFVSGVTVMRAGGCVINDYADRKVDGYVERTRGRPLATGEITPRAALTLFLMLMLAALGLVLLTNTLTIQLSVVGAFLAFTYPFMKRYTYLPQVYLGAAFGWSVPMAYAAQSNEITTITWLLFIATVLWATAYDTIYAMVDRPDDLKIGVKSTAVLLGDMDIPAVAMLQITMLLTLYLAGQRADLGIAWWAGLAASALLFVHQLRLLNNRDRDDYFRAFLNNNWVGIAITVGLLIDTFQLPAFRYG